MNTQMHQLSRLGAMISLALGAAHVQAQTTYTAPLAFNISFVAPTCSLTVGGVTADSPTQVGATTMDLVTSNPLATLSPIALLNGMASTEAFSADGAGLVHLNAPAQRRLTGLPVASAKCTAYTAMTAEITQPSTKWMSLSSSSVRGLPATPMSGQTPTQLNIAMLMGISSFGNQSGQSGLAGVTVNGNPASVGVTATGSDQLIGLTAALYAYNPNALPTGYAGVWSYSYNINLVF